MNDIISNKIPIAPLGHGSQEQEDLHEIRKKRPQDLGCIHIFDQRFRASGQSKVTERADFPGLGQDDQVTGKLFVLQSFYLWV